MSWYPPKAAPGGGYVIESDTGRSYAFGDDERELAERTYNTLTNQRNYALGSSSYVGSGTGPAGGYPGFNIAGGTALLPYQTAMLQMQRQREQDKYLNMPRMETEKQIASWNAAKAYMDWLGTREKATGYIGGGYVGAAALDEPWLAMQKKYAPSFGLDPDYRTPESKQFKL